MAHKDSHSRVEDDELILSPLAADTRPVSAEARADLITARLPLADLSELLIEVDAWTHFSDHFGHAAGADTLRPSLLPHLSASLLAHAGNVGLEQMAHTARTSRIGNGSGARRGTCEKRLWRRPVPPCSTTIISCP